MPPLCVAVLIMITILTVVILFLARRKKVKTATVTKQEEVYYSEVGPPSTSVKHVNSWTKTSPQKFYNKVSKSKAKKARDPDPIHLDQNPAYGTSTTATACGSRY